MPDNNDLTGIAPHVLMASLSYIGVLALIPLFSGATKDPFINFHAKQGLVILAGEIIAILAAIWLSSLGGLLFVLMFIASIMGLFASLHSEKQYIPGIGTIADLFSL